MKKKTTLIILLFFIAFFSFAQTKYIQVEMVDQTPNFSYVGAPTYYYDMPLGATDYSNDAGLNAILSGNNVRAYDTIESIPDLVLSGDGFSHWTLVVCESCDHNQLAANLNAYTSVIKNAYALDGSYAYNQLYLKIVDINVGTVTGVNNDIITTNDANLNAIFTTHNVNFYQQYFPSSSQNSLLRAYTLLCECDATLLKTDLEAHTSVIELVERMNVASQMLSTTEVVFSDVNLYPNPVKNILHISKTTNIKSLEIYSIQGQIMLTQKSQFETIDMTKLASGIYFVKLTDSANRSNTFKVVKN